MTAIFLLAMAFLPLVALSDGGIDPRVPAGTYPSTYLGPIVEFQNSTLERGTSGPLDIQVKWANESFSKYTTVYLEIYRWGVYGLERDLDEIEEPLPSFRYYDTDLNESVESQNCSVIIEILDNSQPVSVPNEIVVPSTTETGYFRVRVELSWYETIGLGMFDRRAYSMGHFSQADWKESIELVSRGEPPTKGSAIVSEAGFTVVPERFNYISKPNLVPDFGDFTTPVIRPGEKGRYNFTVTNRYNQTITDVFVTVEFYMWATIEESKPIEDLDGPVPVIDGIGEPVNRILLPDIPPGGSEPVRLDIATEEDTPKGTYFVRHRIEFVFENETFVMGSRGYYTWDQWEGFDYTNLYYQLGTAGIVPDSSFSVKDPVPLWPLATLIILCILLGTLAVVFYLAEEHGDQYPRLKKGLQYWSGKYQQRKRLMQQRLEDIRADQEADDDDPEDDDD